VRTYTAEQIRAAEAPLLELGAPLMARAAAGLASVIRSVLTRQSQRPGRSGDAGRVLVLVGSGNNGGDALFAAAELAGDGIDVDVLEVGSHTHPEGRSAALEAGAVFGDVASAATLARGAEVVVDGILGTGTGTSPALRGPARDAVAAILPVTDADGGPAVVAVDVPSGIGVDDGAVPDPTVLRADVTVTFGGVKQGMLRQPARDYVGETRVIDIGLGLPQ
jgi:NAD(P)H-hydrate epimerase